MARPLKLHLFFTLCFQSVLIFSLLSKVFEDTPRPVVLLMMLLLKFMILSLHGPSSDRLLLLATLHKHGARKVVSPVPGHPARKVAKHRNLDQEPPGLEIVDLYLEIQRKTMMWRTTPITGI